MALSVARCLVAVFAGWAAIGALFALCFASIGAGRLDPEARSAGLGFRLLILPASAALWPLLLWRWIRGSKVPDERNAHRDAASGVRR